MPDWLPLHPSVACTAQLPGLLQGDILILFLVTALLHSPCSASVHPSDTYTHVFTKLGSLPLPKGVSHHQDFPSVCPAAYKFLPQKSQCVSIWHLALHSKESPFAPTPPFTGLTEGRFWASKDVSSPVVSGQICKPGHILSPWCSLSTVFFPLLHPECL